MLYTGPWRDAIVRLDAAQQIILRDRMARSTAAAPDNVEPPCWPILPAPADASAGSTGSQSTWIGLRVREDIAAALTFAPTYERRERHARGPTIMRVAIWVDPQWRRRGMALALLQHCVSINRAAGVRHLVFFGLESDAALRKLLCRFSADLIFTREGCQAWMELGPVAARVGRPIFAD